MMCTCMPAVRSSQLRSSSAGCTPGTTVPCCHLLRHEVWRREKGFWYGNYTFLKGDGNPYESPAWPYPYQPYNGMIHINITGPHLKQRNVFIYPPLTPAICALLASKGKANHLGAGTCGVNGNEKIFSADQDAVDCQGNLAGPYAYNGLTLDTTTTVMGNDTVIYQVRHRKVDLVTPYFQLHTYAGQLQQNQLTSLLPNGIRVRTAQSFGFTGIAEAASYYREYRVQNKHSFCVKLAELRKAYSILPADQCGYDQAGQPSGVTCAQHFGFDCKAV